MKRFTPMLPWLFVVGVALWVFFGSVGAAIDLPVVYTAGPDQRCLAVGVIEQGREVMKPCGSQKGVKYLVR